MFLLVLSCFIFCKKENAAAGIASTVNSIALGNAVVISKGALVFAAGTSESGTVKIYRQANGKYVLELDNLNYKTMFEPGVYLSSTAGFSSASLKLFSVKDFDEDIYYRIPIGVYNESYKYIMLKKKAAADPAATAPLLQ